MADHDEGRMDEAIDLTSDERPEFMSLYPQLAGLSNQDRAELAFQILVRFKKGESPDYTKY